ncbi:hypothetical protein FNV43_RR18400 [Rhamnella rubrinervis]|uniref:Uncharacterized protein n=1 Tax=Rhamnella rubrinervis TaxID=2594499 RepID=A0A8K0EB07_9ROSA|nr:hypothetical protein FNV43_RR18400 [Rhamnella rubrinervis]
MATIIADIWCAKEGYESTEEVDHAPLPAGVDYFLGSQILADVDTSYCMNSRRGGNDVHDEDKDEALSFEKHKHGKFIQGEMIRFDAG